MTTDEKFINIHLLERTFQIKCPHEQADALQHAAYYLDGKMREIRDSGKAVGNERIAVVSALNLAYELMTIQKQKDLYLDTMNSRLRDLQKKIENALEQEEN